MLPFVLSSLFRGAIVSFVALISVLSGDTSATIPPIAASIDAAVEYVASSPARISAVATTTYSAVVREIEDSDGEPANGYPGHPQETAYEPTVSPTPNDGAQSSIVSTQVYPIHRGIIATVFWIGEPEGEGSSEDNALSAWDDEWQSRYGGFDDPQNRNGFYPANFTPKENPFYLDLPYNDFDDSGTRKANAYLVIPWANEQQWGSRESMMKNRWVKLVRNGLTCYGQIQDAGPYEYDDHAYVFGDGSVRPKSALANNAGLDVSPALRDCLKFDHWNNADNAVNWQFVEATDVPVGPWKEIETISQINWH